MQAKQFSKGKPTDTYSAKEEAEAMLWVFWLSHTPLTLLNIYPSIVL